MLFNCWKVMLVMGCLLSHASAVFAAELNATRIDVSFPVVPPVDSTAVGVGIDPLCAVVAATNIEGLFPA